jgi:hypothetical protein
MVEETLDTLRERFTTFREAFAVSPFLLSRLQVLKRRKKAISDVG